MDILLDFERERVWKVLNSKSLIRVCTVVNWNKSSTCHDFKLDY